FISNDYWLCNKYIHIRYNLVNEHDSEVKDAVNKCYVLHMNGAGKESINIENFDKKFVGRVLSQIKFFK
ncbi:unnamed protein product, partial [Brachionus calyciflorus]